VFCNSLKIGYKISVIVLKETHIVPPQNIPIRLSDYARSIFITVPSRAGMKKAIQKKYVKVNDVIGQTATLLHGGETITLYGLEHSKPVFEKKLEVIFEDDYLAVLNKPAGILVSGNKFQTIENTLPYNLKLSTQKDSLLQPLPVHRLDYPTTGLLLIGKTAKTVIALKNMFEDKLITKTYFAVTYDEMKKEGIINEPINEKASTSTYKVLKTLKSERYNYLNLVELHPKTGRRHQLRKHLASIGTPIFGDIEYGIEGLISKGNGLYLHASNLEFRHPVTNQEMNIFTQLPKKFKRLFSDI
jgi:23S rRNA pseudouridine1911/1915/1917 synthase